MLLPRRAAHPGPAAADRVRGLLAAAPGGWVPPPEPNDLEHDGGVGGAQGVAVGPEPPGAGLELRSRTPFAPADDDTDVLDVRRSWAQSGHEGPRPEARSPALTVPGLRVAPVADGGAESAEGADDGASGVGSGTTLLDPRGRRPQAPQPVPVPVPDPGPPAPGLPGPVAPRWLPPALTRGRVGLTRRAAVGLVLVALLAAVVAGAVVLRGRPQEVVAPAVVATGVPLPGVSDGSTQAPGAGDEPAPGNGATATPREVVVAVAGKVRRPGLVRLPAGSRVDDAVRAAGGALAAGDVGLLNLARPLADGEQVLVGVEPPPGRPPAAGAAASPAGAAAGTTGGPLDLNRASAADLDALPGIGPVLAQRIVDWRTENGRFASVEQLREVNGIGESRFEELRTKVGV